MGWIGCVRCEKFQCDFMAQNCALIAQFQPILHRVSCSIKTLPNAPNTMKCSKTWVVQWGGLGAFVAKNSDATLWHKLVHWLHQFNPFCTKFRVVMKHWQIHPNTTKRTKTWVLGPMEWIRCVRCEKFQCDFMPRTCALILPFQPTLHRVSCINERIQNAPKHYQTHQNKGLRSNGWIRSVRC